MKQTFISLMIALTFFAFGQSQAVAQAKTRAALTGLQYAKTNILGVSSTIFGPQDSTLYDVDATTGTVTKPRTPIYQQINGKMPFIGFAYDGSGTLYGLTASNMQYYASHLFTIGPTPFFGSLSMKAETQLNNLIWRCGVEGDMAYDKTTNKFYATCSNGGWKLVTIDKLSGAVTIKGPISGAGPYTALAFNKAGEAYVLDTAARKLLKLDKNNGNTLSTIPLTGALPNTANAGGMGFNDNGVLYAAFGGKLITINTSTGAITVIGNTLAFSGLIVSGGAPLVVKQF